MNAILELLKVLQNESITNITNNQADILKAIGNISTSVEGGIPTEQINQILSAVQAIPSDTLVNNQTTMKTALEELQNTSIPTLTDNQANILKSISDVLANVKGGIPTEQINQILSAVEAIPSDTLVKNQADILKAITDATAGGGEVSQEQINQILSAIQAIPSDTLVNNQANILKSI